METEVLPSWRNRAAKQAIVRFIQTVTEIESPSYVPPEARIAVFDNDGTLWCEKPAYIQLDFLMRKLEQQAVANPALRAEQPWQAASERDFGWFDQVITQKYEGDSGNLEVLLRGILTVSDGLPVEQMEAEARSFLAATRHPRFGTTYQACIYQPMVELLRYLDAHEFSTYIVSGGGRDFMRGFATELYGIPRQRVIGSRVAYQYVAADAAILQKAELDVIDDGPGKPVQIWHVIGQRPIFAAGNSNGDIEMLEFTAAGGKDRASLCLLVQHDDAQREYAYDDGARKALQLAHTRGWIVTSMEDDWSQVFPAQVR